MTDQPASSPSVANRSLPTPSPLPVANVVLAGRKSRPFFGRHPWVLDSAIERIEGEPADGDVVELISDKGKWIARGIYNSRSRLRVRLYTWNPAEFLDEAFWRGRIKRALALRTLLGYDDPGGAARLVFSEADGVSGLIVDRYAGYLSIMITALAIAARRDQIVSILVDLVRPRGILVRNERGISQAEGLDVVEGLYWGEDPRGPVFIRENGLRFGIDLTAGQKTGFYLDQRENRRAAAGYCRAARVLDLFCYSGGFSLAAALLGGAKEVLGIDGSQRAIALARANAELNGLANVHFEQADCFHKLQQLAASGQRFDCVVLDPPRFTRSRQSLNEALRAYHHLNRLGVAVLQPGGILVTCSCSGHVSREDFLFMLSGVAQQTKRDIQVLEQRGAAPDHPVSATCLETAYLKCFVCRVE